MTAVNYSAFRVDPQKYCEKASEEAVIVTGENEKNIVLISLEQYNRLTKAMENLEYLKKIESGIAQIEAGTCKPHELIEVDEDGEAVE